MAHHKEHPPCPLQFLAAVQLAMGIGSSSGLSGGELWVIGSAMMGDGKWLWLQPGPSNSCSGKMASCWVLCPTEHMRRSKMYPAWVSSYNWGHGHDHRIHCHIVTTWGSSYRGTCYMGH